MRLIKYNTEQTDDKIPTLVKEKSFNYESYESEQLKNPNLISKMFNSVFRLNKQTEEYVYLLCLNSKCKPVGIFEISHGTVNASLLSPREIYCKALLCGAVNIVVCHNHPSGNTEPSKDDIDIYNKIKKAGELLDIKLIDFLIIGETTLSFYEMGF